MKRHYVLTACILAAGLFIGGAVAREVLDDSSPSGRPELTVLEGTRAVDNGISLEVTRAAYSASAVWLELALISDSPSGFVVPGSDLGGTFELTDRQASLTLTSERPTVVRFRGVSDGGPYELVITGGYLTDASPNPAKYVPGEWHFRLAGPADARTALRAEMLEPTGAATRIGDVEVRAVRGLRSTSETLVTLAFEGPAGVGEIFAPRLVGTENLGARVEWNPDILVATYSFPPTPFGDAVAVSFDAFAVRANDQRSQVRFIELADVLSRVESKVLPGTEVPLVSGDSHGSAPETVGLLSVWFAASEVGGTPNLVAFWFTGAIDDQATGFQLTLADGTAARLVGSGTDFGTAASGADVGQPRSYVQFRYQTLDQLNGTVALTIGEPLQILAGPWTVQFGVEER